MNIAEQVSVGIWALWENTKMGTAAQMAYLVLYFCQFPILIYRMCTPVYVYINIQWKSFLTTDPAFVILVLLTLAMLTGEWWNLKVVLIFISLIFEVYEHIFEIF